MILRAVEAPVSVLKGAARGPCRYPLCCNGFFGTLAEVDRQILWEPYYFQANYKNAISESLSWPII